MRTSNYSFFEMIQNCIYIILSKILFKKSRLIRFPIYIRGKKYINFGFRTTTGRFCRIEVNGIHQQKVLVFGQYINIGDNVSIRCSESITIGDYVLIGSKVLIIDNSHGCYSGENQDSPLSIPNSRDIVSAPIQIGSYVWICEGAIIQKGVCIGEGSIVLSNSVVTHSVPPYTMVGGIPAKIIKKFNFSNSKWEKV